ncbi:hypothetical protein [Virgisporangium ochraceum]|uniref:Uncharacterized protein n=1 Tax=Virgisporangium ochraceum TaxID=65505 RepID=A0A8J3ZKR4_9ACTN|nr:hypothetical protein [Virgisporangium ochraceum]GIJ65551.1 hypothetical protein Voc01_004680 [Virgisporangium ochraceum]
MSRITRLTRRTLALSAATFLGAVGAVAFATAPASAHAASLTSTVACVEGKPNTVKVTWKLTHDMDKRADVSDVVLNRTPGGVGQIQNGAQLASKESTLVGSREFATDAGAQTLTATVKWPGTTQEKGVANTARWNRFDCGPEESAAVSDCNGLLTVKIQNVGAQPKLYEVVPKGGTTQSRILAPGQVWDVVMAPQEHAGEVKVRSKRASDQSDGGWSEKSFSWVRPDACFEATSKSTCEDLVITVKNTGAKPIKATVAVGSTSRTTEIQPGKEGSLSLDGVDGLVAKLTVDGKATDFAWAKPAGCDPGLPVTGANAGLLAGTALVLVAGGGGLFFLARRRRIRFAA